MFGNGNVLMAAVREQQGFSIRATIRVPEHNLGGVADTIRVPELNFTVLAVIARVTIRDQNSALFNSSRRPSC